MLIVTAIVAVSLAPSVRHSLFFLGILEPFEARSATEEYHPHAKITGRTICFMKLFKIM